MRLSDFLWFSILAAILSLVAWIGTIMIIETRHTAAAIENVHRIKDWMSVNGPRAQHTSQVDEPPEDCTPPKGTLAACADWVDQHPPKAASASAVCSAGGGSIRNCLDHLVSATGDLKEIRNPFSDQAPVFSAACSSGNPQTLGTMMVFIGKPKSSTDPSLEYKVLKSQSLDQPAALRFMVCGRLYRPSVPVDFRI